MRWCDDWPGRTGGWCFVVTKGSIVPVLNAEQGDEVGRIRNGIGRQIWSQPDSDESRSDDLGK